MSNPAPNKMAAHQHLVRDVESEIEEVIRLEVERERAVANVQWAQRRLRNAVWRLERYGALLEKAARTTGGCSADELQELEEFLTKNPK